MTDKFLQSEAQAQANPKIGRLGAIRNPQSTHVVIIGGGIAGLSLAARHYGRLPWRELLQPAIDWVRLCVVVVPLSGATPATA